MIGARLAVLKSISQRSMIVLSMPLEKVIIKVYFKNLLGITAIAKSIAKYVPDKVEQWGENVLQKRYE